MSDDTTAGDAFGQPKAPKSNWRAPSPALADPPPPAAIDPAGWWHRVAGWIVDASVAMAAGVGAGALAAESMTDDEAAGIAVAVTVVVWLLNTTVLVGITRGQSLAKLIGGTRIVGEDGTPAGAGTGFRRDFLLRLPYVIGIFFVVDSLWPLSTDRRTLRDKFARTHVVREPSYRRRSAGLVLAMVLSVTALGIAFDAAPASWTEDSYSASDRRTFIEICEDKELTQGSCECAYDRLSKVLPYSEFEPLIWDVGEPSTKALDALEAAYSRCTEDDLKKLIS